MLRRTPLTPRALRGSESRSARSPLKSELGERFESCREAKMELFDYIEVF